MGQQGAVGGTTGGAVGGTTGGAVGETTGEARVDRESGGDREKRGEATGSVGGAVGGVDSDSGEWTGDGGSEHSARAVSMSSKSASSSPSDTTSMSENSSSVHQRRPVQSLHRRRSKHQALALCSWS